MKNALVALAIVVLMAISARSVCAGTVVVSPTNMNGWSFVTVDSNGDPAVNLPYTNAVAQMVNGPATPPLGTGSAQLETGAGGGDGAARLITSSFSGTLLSNITSLSYSTYDTVNNGQQFPYLKLVLSNGDAIYFEPPYQTPSAGNSSLPDQGATAMNQWQSWNAAAGGWWDDNVGNAGTGVLGLAYYQSLFPGVTIDAIKFSVGFADPTDSFNGYVDAFTIGTSAGSTTFDFELNAPAPAPEPASLASLAMIGLAVGGWATLRHRKQPA